MPQVAKAANQVALENRISKCKQLLRHLNSSLKSMRARNKAERERNRREEKMKSLDRNIQAAYGGLADGIQKDEEGAESGEGGDAIEDADADIELDEEDLIASGEKSASSTSLKKRMVDCGA